MKTFRELVGEPGFAISLAIAFLLAGYNLAYGSWWIGFIFFILIMGSIALNIWKTRKQPKGASSGGYSEGQKIKCGAAPRNE